MEAIWDWSDRVYPAAALLAVGLALFARGIIVHFRGWRLPSNRPRKNLTIVRGMRMFLLGASLAAVGAGWLWHLPILIAAGLVIGFEETLETSIAAWALRQEVETKLTPTPCTQSAPQVVYSRPP